MAEIKAIETAYNGYRFRSRLEARWAVFFDTAGINYRYETEGYTLHGDCYLPDFYLPDFDVHVEVKGNRDGAWDEIEKASKFIEWGGPIKILVVLGNLPNKYDGGMWHYPCMYYSVNWDGPAMGWWFFHDGEETVYGDISAARYIKPWHISEDGKISGIYDEIKDFQPVSDTILSSTLYPLYRGYRHIKDEKMVIPEDEFYLVRDFNQLTFKSFDAAKKERFEHGKTGGK